MEKHTIINLTPHGVNVYDEKRTFVGSIGASGDVARVDVKREYYGFLSSEFPAPVYYTTSGNVIGLPDQRDGVLLLVSTLVREALKGRLDLLSPGDAIRDEKGVVIGCIGFTCN